jgi:hypothetical protein
MELGSCISQIIHHDDTLTNIIIKPTCVTACSNYEPDESDDVDSIKSKENSINKRIYFLNDEYSGSREWFANFGVMISRLPNLAKLTFVGLNIHASELERFWGEISASASLTTLIYTNMNLEHWEGGVDPPSLKSILFQRCTNIPNNIGYILHEDQFSLTKLQFDDCSFVNTNSMKEIVAFATELTLLQSITSFCFTSCSFDHVQKMCLVRCLREERDNPDNLEIRVW